MNMKMTVWIPLASVAFSSRCRDLPGFEDPEFGGCEWAESFEICYDGDVLYPKDFFLSDENGVYAWEACCACGGGMREGPKCDGLKGKPCRQREGCVWKNRKKQCIEAETDEGADKCTGISKGKPCRNRGCEWKNRKCVAPTTDETEGEEEPEQPEETESLNPQCREQSFIDDCVSRIVSLGGCAIFGHDNDQGLPEGKQAVFEKVMTQVPSACFKCQDHMGDEVGPGPAAQEACENQLPGESPGNANECAELSGFACRRRGNCDYVNRRCVPKESEEEEVEEPCSGIKRGFTCRRSPFGCKWVGGECMADIEQRRLPAALELEAPIQA